MAGPHIGEDATLVDVDGTGRLGEYVLGRLLGEGGMGVVFAGHHAATGRPVAIKVMRAGTDRFEREVQALSSLRHPGVVEYIDHGITPDRRPFLVMEWLAGEDLQARLRRGPLAVVECVALALRLADALAAAHARGIVHRDIKPSNVFLPDGAIDQAKLLDFGVARVGDAAHTLTRTGAMIGTVGFMAPEQARGEAVLDGRADLFALGCVLFECLAGTPAFAGEHPLAVLAKILLDDPPHLGDLRADVPAELAELIAALLAKSIEARPRGAAEVVARLAGMTGEPSPAATRGVTLAEQRVLCLLLVRARPEAELPLGLQVTGSADDEPTVQLQRLAEAFGASFSPMLGGSGVICVGAAAPSSDAVIQVARCALAIRRALPEAVQVFAVGRGLSRGPSFIGRVIDEVVAQAQRMPPGIVALNATAAELLTERFECTHDGERRMLISEREEAATRTLLGRPAPFVGRTRELAALDGLFRGAIEDSRSCLVLVVGEPGIGKSRLWSELVRALAAGGHKPLVLVGRGDPITRGAGLGLVRAALRREFELGEADEIAVQHTKLDRRVEAVLPAGERARVTTFLCELCGLHGEGGSHGSAVRRDATAVADAMRVAWIDWLQAESRRRAVLLVLEDLHWGDAASVAFVEAAVQGLRDAPLMVLALARPDVHAVFPELWAGCEVHRIGLTPISARASELLVQQVLGRAVDAAVVRRIVARTEGHPFFLEELVRAASAGQDETLPDTVLGVIQARLQRLGDQERRLLRAASVYGGDFSEAGVAAVLGEPEAPVRSRLLVLLHGEFISREAKQAAGFRFRHALVRDAAYAMLPDEERALAHRLAAQWLVRQDGCEPGAVAEHFRRGGATELARTWFRVAAEQALDSGALDAAVERAEQAVACDAEGVILGELRLLQAEARVWAGRLTDAERWAEAALELLEVGSLRWFIAVQRLIYCRSLYGDIEGSLAWLARAESATAAADADCGLLLCIGQAVYTVNVDGRREVVEPVVERFERLARATEIPAVWLGQVYRARATALAVMGYYDQAARVAGEGARFLGETGDLRNRSRSQVLQGHSLMLAGDEATAEALLREARENGRRVGAEHTCMYADLTLADLFVRSGRLAEARALLATLLPYCQERGDPRAEGMVRIDAAWLAQICGQRDAAEAHIGRCLQLLAGQRPLELWARAVELRIRGMDGGGEVAAVAQELLAAVRGFSGVIDYEGYVWLALVDAFTTAGVVDEADAALRDGLVRLRQQLARLTDPTLRRTYLAMAESHGLIAHARRRGIDVADLAAGG